MRVYPLVAIMLVALVGCGSAEKEKAEQKAALMREYEFEKSVLSTLEKELAEMEKNKKTMDKDRNTMDNLLETASTPELREKAEKIYGMIRVYSQAIESKADEIKLQKTKIKNMESTIKEMKN